MKKETWQDHTFFCDCRAHFLPHSSALGECGQDCRDKAVGDSPPFPLPPLNTHQMLDVTKMSRSIG